MAEDQGKEEEKFDFTPEGEGYISLAEARVLAVRTAVETPGDYGRQYRGVAMVFEVAESGEDEDFYTVTLSFRPQGRFDGTPGQEQFVIGKDGTIAVRQVLSSLVREGGGFPVLPVAIGVVIVGAIAAVGAFLLISSSGGDSVPVAVAAPTKTPTTTETLTTIEPTVNINATVEAGIQQELAARATLVPPTPISVSTLTPIMVPPTPSPVPTDTPRSAYTPTPVPMYKPLPTYTPAPILTPRPTPYPTSTPWPTPLRTATPYPTPTPRPTPIPTPTAMPLPIPTPILDSAVGYRGFRLTLSPSTAVPGQEVVLIGTGASYNGDISQISIGYISIDSLSNGNQVSSISTDSSGNFSANLVIPNTAVTRTPGSHTVRVSDNGGNFGEVTLRVPSRIVSMSTNSSSRGSTVTMAGSGFFSNDHLQVYYRTDQLEHQVGTTTANTYGNWTAEFTVPSNVGIPSENLVEISDSRGSTNTLFHRIPGATILVYQTPVNSGSSVVMYGSNFPGFASVRKITIGSGNIEITPVPYPSTDASGNFSSELSLPSLPIGTYTVRAEVHNVSAITTVKLK